MNRGREGDRQVSEDLVERAEVSSRRGPALALAGVGAVLVAVVGVSTLGRFQGGPATGASPTPVAAGSPIPTGPRFSQPGGSPIPTTGGPTPTIGPVFHETLPLVYTGRNLHVEGWSPDGSRFAVLESPPKGDTPKAWTIHLFDRTGAEIGSVNGTNFAWIDSSTYVVLRPTSSMVNPLRGGYDAYLGHVGSSTLSWLGTYDWMVAGLSGAVALILPWDGTVTSPPKYRVVTPGVALDTVRSTEGDGYPLGWSRDGSALAVFHPNRQSSGCCEGNTLGWIEVVGVGGGSLAAARSVESSLTGLSASFSPDGTRVAFRDDTDAPATGEQIGVLQVATGGLTRIPKFGLFTWASNDELVFVDLSSSIPTQNDQVLSWSAVTGALTPYATGTTIGASGSGLVVVGNQTESQLSVTHRVNGKVVPVETLTLGGWPLGGVPDRAWSPDGRSLVLVSGESGLEYEDLVLAAF